ncbi:MAG: murein biosynthesis integral membrane protein MurJ [Roseiflexaceae bacterium]|nr:murein biosynthesis integral membrane protein MurJ [Roseiflexus sp.]MDW8212182.1 murein biosynthesis integral membrane protein MurJ [Roseiflexaceae bacterium]
MKRALLNTIIVATGYLASRVLGLARDVLISHQFGTSAELAAFRASFGILDLIYLVVAGGALGSAFIPVFSEALEQRRDAWRLASAVLNLTLLALTVACTLVWILAAPLVALTVGRGLNEAERALTVDVLRLMLIQPFLLGVGGLAKATLESFNRFTLPAIGSNLYNLGIIGGALLGPWLGVYGLVWGVNVGAALFVLVQLPGLRAIGATYRIRDKPDAPGEGAQPCAPGEGAQPCAPTKADSTYGEGREPGGARTDSLPFLNLFYAEGVGRMLRLLGPRIFGQSAWQINMIAIVSLASTLGSAALAANAYALQLMMLPHGLIALSLATVLFPEMARQYAAGDRATLRATALGGVRAVLFLALPASAVLGVLALPVLRALFQRGAFDATSAALTTEALSAYALGLAGFAAAEIVVRAFFAMQDTRTPVIVGIAAVALNISLGWSFLRLGMGLSGLGLAFSLANLFEAVLLLALLGRRLGGLERDFLRATGAMILATLVCVFTLALLHRASFAALPPVAPGDTYRWPGDFLPLLAWLAGAATAGVLAYAGVAALFRVPELGATIARGQRVLMRVRLRLS